MNFFSIRTNDQKTIGNILDKKNQVIFDTLSWHKTEISIDDLVFIVISGDSAKKIFEYENGLRAIGKVIQLPIDEKDGKHFKLKVEIIEFLPKSITKDDFYVYPILKDAPNIGPDTKSAPNQAFRKIEEEIGRAIINAVADLLQNNFDKSKFAKYVNNQYEIEKLQVIQNKPDHDNKPKSINKTYNIVLSEFIKWFENPTNYKKSYEGLVNKKVLSFWDEIYFNQSLFNIDTNDLAKSILKIEKMINNKDNAEWKKYSEATSNGAPEAIIGKNNYLKFLYELSQDNAQLKLINTIPKAFNYKQFYRDCVAAKIFIDIQLSRRIAASLIAKSFLLLTGLSGSGKTKLAQAFAMWICESKRQYSIVPVGADWTNREPLLGFPNSLKNDEYVKPDNGALDLIIEASTNETKPYFLILDEMNLSHVERYFADFLSVMESKDSIKLYEGGPRKSSDGMEIPPVIIWPENLFIIGTVNIDETTYMFSPKVLDRANVIEFSVTMNEMQKYMDNTGVLYLENLMKGGTEMALDFIHLSNNKSLNTIERKNYQKTLLKFFDELKKTGAEFGYRSASEIIRYVDVVNTLEDGDMDEDEILDSAIMQKLLPKVHGSRRRLAPVLETLGLLCFKEVLNEKDKIKEYLGSADKTITIPGIKYPLSFDKISRMYRNLINNGFTSYAEA